MDLWPAETLALIAAIFVLAGFVKGVVGLGMPTVSLGLLTTVLGLEAAIALMLVPSFATNVWQALEGGAFLALLRRLRGLLLAACLGIWFGAAVLARSDAALLSGLLGLSLALYALTGLTGFSPPSPGRREVWISPGIGLVNGVMTGLTGAFVVPGVAYLQALDLARDNLIQAMGILFMVSTVALAAALADHRLLSAELGGLSAAAMAPAFLGLWLGRALRTRIPETRFRRVFLSALLLLGVYIAARAIL